MDTVFGLFWDVVGIAVGVSLLALFVVGFTLRVHDYEEQHAKESQDN